MITKSKGNLLKTDVDALVNTVNTVGVMGKGIALQFKKAFPDNFDAYKKACDSKKVKPGKIFIFQRNDLFNPKYIFNFPTKQHWKGSSKLEDIKTGLEDLIFQVKKLNIRSIALPPLGCGHGGLQWDQVYPLIEDALAKIPEVEAQVFPPLGAPDPKSIINKTEAPDMTAGRAAIIRLMSDYSILGYRTSLLEIYKLAYFLQLAGEPLKLNFQKHTYGPYAQNLRHVLNRIDGHFISGFGDGEAKPDIEIELMPDAEVQAASFLKNMPQTLERFRKVSTLIEGFENPYGMELLSTVHWVAAETKADNQLNLDQIVSKVYSWNENKRQFSKKHIEIAWNRLKEQNWI